MVENLKNELKGFKNLTRGIFGKNVFKDYEEPISKLFNPKEEYTFLVGAGISISPPSSVPSARSFVHHLIQYYAPPHDVEPLENLESLRYEIIVDMIQEFFDKDLKFLDYLEEIKEPNLIHHFLARAIVSGNNLITTNFDYLIEHALKELLPSGKWEKIVPVITKEQFITYKNPEEFVKKNNYLVYKVHGSKKNIISGENTKESLITTISALGKNKGPGITFTIEEFKKEPFENITREKTLVVMGYSGSDDFDIGPTLSQLPHLKRLIWIEHDWYTSTDIRVIKSEEEGLERSYALGITKILADLKVRLNIEVIQIITNTIAFVKDIMWPNIFEENPEENKLIIDSNEDKASFEDWIHQNLEEAKSEKKYRFSCEIYSQLGKMNLSRKSAEIGIETNNLQQQEYCNLVLGIFYANKRLYEKALEFTKKSITLSRQLGNDLDLAWGLINLAPIRFYYEGNFQQALELCTEAMEINKDNGDLLQRSILFRTLGNMYFYQADNEKALELYKQSLSVDTESGILLSKSQTHYQIALLLITINKLEDAYHDLKESIRISEQLNDQYLLASSYFLLGDYYDRLKKYGKGLNSYQKARKSSLKTGGLYLLVQADERLARSFTRGGFYTLAWDYLNEGLKYTEDTIPFFEKTNFYKQVANTCKAQENYEDAIKYYNKAIDSAVHFKDIFSEASIQNELALTYIKQEDYEEALQHAQRATEIYELNGKENTKNYETYSYNLNYIRKKIEDSSLTEEELKNVEPNLSIEKDSFTPGDLISVSFSAPSTFDKTAWIGLIPSEIDHYNEELADEYDISYYYLENKTRGRVKFKAPESPGSYDFRLFDKNGNGKEYFSLSFEVEKVEMGFTLNKSEYKASEVIQVEYIINSSIAESGWIGIFPSKIPHHDQELAWEVLKKDWGNYQTLEGKLKNKIILEAPEFPGTYQARLYSGETGEEIMFIEFVVKE